MKESEAELPSDELYKSTLISDKPQIREPEAELLKDIVNNKSSEFSEFSEYIMEEDANINYKNESFDNKPFNDDKYHKIFEAYSYS
ncbi:hypothetical protein RhiirA5_433285 [Rhizophagus irregularis]|uniref:Uncharacterized protein n=1 Tax=Rhizophagus irregularis TaxID=588596 RepID=A0A2N0NS31_9GLOM|nr:hypothetical protein RhiirA5_433285 [Rhizophagus irregularis]